MKPTAYDELLTVMQLRRGPFAGLDISDFISGWALREKCEWRTREHESDEKRLNLLKHENPDGFSVKRC